MKLDNTPTRIDSSLDLDAVRTECLELVKKRAYLSAGASAVPIPLLDVAFDAGMLSQLLPEISYKFGLAELQTEMFNPTTREINWKVARERGVAFAGLVASRGVTRMTIQGMGTRILSRQVIKFIPLGGTIVAASMGYFVFKKIGTSHVDDCYKTAKGIQLKSASST
ncbi:MAG: hypothetical protein NVS3B3_08890 [Aquirhabdus sp.]